MAYTWLHKNIFDSYSLYIFSITTFLYVSTFYVLARVSNYSLGGLFFLVSTLPWYSGSLRQMMALCFVSLAILYLFESRRRRAFSFFVLAAFFHFSALLLLWIPFVYGGSIFSYGLLLFGLALLGPLASWAVQMLDFFMTQIGLTRTYSTRIGGTLTMSNPVMGLARKILTAGGLIFFALLGGLRLNTTSTSDQKMLFLCVLAICSIIFYLLGTFFISHFSSRMDIYTGIFAVALLIGMIDYRLEKNWRWVFAVFVLLLALVFYLRLEWMFLFHPYQSIFYNFDFERDGLETLPVTF